MKRKILIVEDEGELLRILEKTFVDEGFEVITATDGKEGLDKAIAEKPGMILLDIITPVMDGVGLLNELRKDPWGKEANVIVLTNLSYSKGLEPFIQFPSQQPKTDSKILDFLVKPDWELKEIVQKVKEKYPPQEE